MFGGKSVYDKNNPGGNHFLCAKCGEVIHDTPYQRQKHIRELTNDQDVVVLTPAGRAQARPA